MARPKRNVKAKTSTPSSVDPSESPVTTIFSASRQLSQKSSPGTSDVEMDSPSVNLSKKRGYGQETGEEELAAPVKKLKATASVKSELFIELPSRPRRAATNTPSRSSKTPAVSTKRTPRSAATSEDEMDLVSQDGLDFVEESDVSGSEFEVSDEEEEVENYASYDEEPVEEVKVTRSGKKRSPAKQTKEEIPEPSMDQEELDLQMALARSMTDQPVEWMTGFSSAGAGGSSLSKILNATSTDVLKAELGSQWDEESAAFSDVEILSAEDVPLILKGKGKAKAIVKGKGKQKATVETAYSKSKKSYADRRRELKVEERELALKLGRRLTWAERSTVALYRTHPELRNVWGDLEEAIPVTIPKKAQQPAGLKVTLLPFQQESLFWMREQERGLWKGGMLADEMGMGKTIQTIALLVSDESPGPNLVVAPTVAIIQWRNEIEKHTDGMKVLVWHGAGREQNVKELKKYNVVLTSYAVLESGYRKQQSGFKRKGQIIKEKSAMHQIEWNRVVLDEAHNIKERSTNTAKAAFELKSTYKWCLSGTPLQNRVGELYSLIRFLGGDPFSYYFCKECDCKSLHWKFSDKKSCDQCHHTPMQHTCFWNNEILTPISKNGMLGPGKDAFKKLRILLDRVMLRRTKVERADDLGLPPRTVTVRRDYFSPEEKELYTSLFSDATRQFSTYVDAGTLLNNYSNIFSLITRMRQMACHPDLVLRSKRNAEIFSADEETTVCRLCSDVAEDAIESKCRHIFDRECIKQYLNTAVEQTPDCPICHVPLSIDLEAPALEINEAPSKARQGILGRLDIDKWRSSTKIEALVEELSNARREDATTKSLVFSQFVNFLDLIAFRLQRAGFTVCRLEGTMSPQARDATIQHFMNNVNVTVFLVSLKAGGVALNLTEASRVYLMDSWWNPAVEFQAMDRIHRLGQHRPVQAIKLVVEDSIESRIVQLQEKKSAMVDATLSSDDSAMGRLTPEDLSFLFKL